VCYYCVCCMYDGITPYTQVLGGLDRCPDTVKRREEKARKGRRGVKETKRDRESEQV
jgi:hypothetical protein